jgi:hypothetical protein
MTDRHLTDADVDWAEVEQRGRRLNWLALPAVPLFFAAVVLLTGGYAFWEGAAAWTAVGVFMLFAVVMQALGLAVPRFRARARQSLRIQYALRHRIDPGPELRETTDRYAGRMAANAWFVWLLPWLPVSFLLNGRWDSLGRAIPSALVIVGCAVALVLWWWRQGKAARQWVADPPGPPREMPPPHRWERWTTGRRLVWLALGVVAVMIGSTAVLVALR